jgi:hypothetical protein
MRKLALGIAITILLILLLTTQAPVEKTLGANARIVYLHGAWVWAALVTLLAAGIVGAVGLLLGKRRLHQWSRCLSQSGLVLWIIFLAMSLYVMQVNWNGLFLDEPRFRIPLNFAIVGLLLQVGLYFFADLRLASAVNLAYAIALFIGIQGMTNVLHPISPVLTSNSQSIQLFFSGLAAIILILAWQFARLLLLWQFPILDHTTETH